MKGHYRARKTRKKERKKEVEEEDPLVSIIISTTTTTTTATTTNKAIRDLRHKTKIIMMTGRLMCGDESGAFKGKESEKKSIGEGVGYR